MPKQDRLILIPMPEAATRTAALLSGQVNWIEAPSPDAIPRLKSAGMQIITNTYPHNWPYSSTSCTARSRTSACARPRTTRSTVAT